MGDAGGVGDVTFTRTGVATGARRCLPLALGVLAYGTVFGVLARQAGLAAHEAALMSGIVYAGTSQFLAIDLWMSPLPVATIVLTTLVVNLRHLLMGAALRPWFAELPAPLAYGLAFFVVDENWAAAMAAYERGERDAGFFLGGGLILFAAWLPATVVGYSLGAAVRDPAAWGLDFAFTAAFGALLVGFWRGRSSLLPWGVAAVVAVAAERWLPGQWYILLGGMAGSLVGAVRRGE